MRRVIENNGLVPTVVLGFLLQPGQSRDVDVPDELSSAVPEGSPPAPGEQLPDEANPQDLRPEWPEKLVALQALPVAKLKAGLLGLTGDELQQLAQIEEAAETPRSSVLELLAAEQLKLARQAAGGEPS